MRPSYWLEIDFAIEGEKRLLIITSYRRVSCVLGSLRNWHHQINILLRVNHHIDCVILACLLGH